MSNLNDNVYSRGSAVFDYLQCRLLLLIVTPRRKYTTVPYPFIVTEEGEETEIEFKNYTAEVFISINQSGSGRESCLPIPM